jgi:glycosyltransferase involved in cell wall biosynthesis
VEVIVVNDGSKDGTLQIARQYQSGYPQIVTVIDKENGHYGSCINAALPVAKGKYVKVLDADDWFDTDAFDYLIAKLQTLDSDLVITNYSERHISGKKNLIHHCSQEYTIRHDVPSPSAPIFPLHLEMQAVTYRTELLRRMNYRQSEGIAYTDAEWIFVPIFFVETVSFIHANVYQYLLGRAGQTVNPLILDRNFAHNSTTLMRRLDCYAKFDTSSLSQQKKDYLQHKMRMAATALYRLCLIWQPENVFTPEEARSFDLSIREKDKDFYESLSEEKVYRYFPFKHIRYWRKHAKRLPVWLLCVPRTVRKTIHRLRSIRRF